MLSSVVVAVHPGPEPAVAATVTDFELMIDINQTGADSRPDSFVATSSGLYFSADDGVHGNELWLTDGTTTQMVADIDPNGSSVPRDLIEAGGEVYFSASTPELGRELWKTDGTALGTVLVKDISTGTTSSNPDEFTVFDGELWFAADTPAEGTELWHTDGTEAGTELLLDAVPGSADFDPADLTPATHSVHGDLLYFSAETTSNGREIHWLSAGSATPQLHNLNGTADSNPSGLFAIGDDMYYAGLDGSVYRIFRVTDLGAGLAAQVVGGENIFSMAASPAVNPTTLYFGSATSGDPTNRELYKVDGGTTTVELVKEINPSASSSLFSLAPFGSRVMFRADNGINGSELWISDGTEIGTNMVEDLWPGPDHSVPSRLTQIGPLMVFQAVTANDRELWVSDGTAGGTYEVADINPAGGSNPSLFYRVGGSLVFVADDPVVGRELMVGQPGTWTEGATDNVSVLADINTGTKSSDPRLFTPLGDDVFLVADDGVHGLEPMLIDTATGQASLLRDIEPGPDDSEPSAAVAFDGKVLFEVYDDVNGSEIWQTDGTELGTTILVDIAPGPDSSDVDDFFATDEFVLFGATNGIDGNQLWKTDGTALGTEMVSVLNATGDGDPGYFVSFGDEVAFLADDGNGDQLWLTDGTVGGARTVLASTSTTTNVFDFVVTGDLLVFTVEDELWVSDGTSAGSSAIGLDDLGSFDHLTASGGRVFFTAEDDDASETGIWVTSGTLAGTEQVLALTGDLSSSIDGFGVLPPSGVVWAQRSGAAGEELYVSDGTAAGTGPMAEINPGPDDGPDTRFLAALDLVFFTADDGVTGTEWWQTDGSTATRLADTFPGGYDGTDAFRLGNDDDEAAVVGDWFIARSYSPEHGDEPWFTTVTPDLPRAPATVSAVAGVGQATISWSPSPDETGGPVVGYTVTASPGGNTCVTTTALTCVVMGLAPGVSHVFTVVATNRTGNSPASPASNTIVVLDLELDAAAKFVPLSPQRLFDTRPAEAAPGPKGKLVDGQTIDVQVTGVGGVPADAVAVVMNLTVVDTDAIGFVTAFPTGTTRPNASSVNIVQAGQVRPNLVTVSIGDGGKVSLFSRGGSHLLGDVAGYYVDSDLAVAAGRFVAVTPQRLFDTRPAEAAPGPKGKLVADQTIEVRATGFGDVPASGVAAIVINLTATEASGPGFVTAFPTGEALPKASNLNLAAVGDTAPNLAIVPVGDGGKISFYSKSGAHLLGDITGYMTDDTAASVTAGLFVPLDPVRVFDTREEEVPPGPKGFVAAGATIDVAVAGAVGIPADAAAVVLNVTGINSPIGYLTAWERGSTRPKASTLNFAPPLDTRANAAMLPVGVDGEISVFTLNGSDILADAAGYFLG